MKNIYSTILISLTISFFILCAFTPAFSKERIKNIQIGAYIGPVVFLSVSDAKGTYTGDKSDTKISGVDAEQNIIWGFNGRCYFGSSRFGSGLIDTGLDTDIAFSSLEITKDKSETEIDMISFSLFIRTV
jgi:hypothetical protein